MTENKKIILLVEDNSITAKLEKKELEKAGYIVHLAETGEKAIESVLEKNLHADLILMDIDLGEGIDGTEAAEKILASKDLPVVFLSSHTDPAVVEKTEKITSYGYVVKNTGIVVLDASIKMALKLFNANKQRQIIEDVLQESNRRLESFLRISSNISSPMKKDQLMQSIVDNAAAVIGIGSSAVYLLKDEDSIYLEAATPALPENFPEKFRVASLIDHPHVNDAIKTGRFVFIPDVLTEELTPAEEEIMRMRNLRSQLFIPIMLKGDSIGVLILSSIENLYTFTDEIITLLQGFANQAAQIIENVRNYEALKGSEKRAALQRTSLSELFKNQALYGGDVAAAMQLIVKFISDTLGTARASVWTLSHDGSELRCISLYQANDGTYSCGDVLKTAEYPAYFKAMMDRNRIYVDDAFNDPSTCELADPYLRPQGITSLLDGGIFIEGRLAGVVSSEHVGPMRKWFHDEESFISTAASMAAQIFIDAERKKAEEKLRESEVYNRSIIEAIPDIIVLTNSEGEYLDIHTSSAEHLAINKEKLLGKKITDIFPEKTAASVLDGIHKSLNTGALQLVEYELTVPAGECFYEARIVPRGGDKALAIIRDITARKEAEDEIKKQLSEKEILLKEIHHRVKNNIANIEGLLILQLEESPDPEVKSALQDALSRVQSIRILYDKLLLGGDYHDISIKDYIGSLIDSLAGIFYKGGNISVEKHIEDFHVNSKTAVPVGIIVNELLTNVYKYAFDGRSSGRVSIVIEKKEELADLIIHDNGIGINEEIESGKTSGFGLTIVKMLADQLKGSYTIKNDKGTKNILKFQV